MSDRVWFCVLTSYACITIPPLAGAAAATFMYLAQLGTYGMITAFASVTAFTLGVVIAFANMLMRLFLPGQLEIRATALSNRSSTSYELGVFVYQSTESVAASEVQVGQRRGTGSGLSGAA